MEDEDKMLPDWLANMIMLKIPKEMQNQFKEDTLLKYENEIDKLTQKCNELRKYEGECYQLKLDLKHYEKMKEEMKMKDSSINRLQEEILSDRKNIMKVIEEIKIEIDNNPRSANIGKKGCLRRLYKILGE